MTDFGFPGSFESCIKLSRLHHLDEGKNAGSVHFRPSLEQPDITSLKITPVKLPEGLLFPSDEINTDRSEKSKPGESLKELRAERKMKKRMHKSKPSPTDNNVYVKTLHEVNVEPRSTKFMHLILEERRNRWSAAPPAAAVDEPVVPRLPKLSKGMHGIPGKQPTAYRSLRSARSSGLEHSASAIHRAMTSERLGQSHRSAPGSQLSHQSNLSAKEQILSSGHALDLPERLRAY